jgi:hypothetical protein
MDLIVSHPAFKQQRLVVRTARFFAGPRILRNDQPVKRTKGTYVVRDDSGTDVALRLSGNFVDPIPILTIDDEKIQLARPLAWYEYVWVGIPVLLLFVGGALGAAIGIVATYTSSRIIRSDRSVGRRYAFAGLVSICAFITFFVAATALQVILARVQH